MSEPEQEQQPVDEHTAIYLRIRDGVSKNDMLYEFLTSSIRKFLPNVQAVEDALNMMCVSMSKPPLESLLLIHEFLQNYHNIVQHEHKTEQAEPTSPFIGRQS